MEMEQQTKVDKRNKAYKESLTAANLGEVFKPTKQSILDKLIESGIPVWRAQFHQAVNNGQETPETAFSTKSAMKSKHVKMWLCAGGTLLVCEHNNKRFATSASNVIKCDFDEQH